MIDSPKVAASALPDAVAYCCSGSLVNPAELQDYIQVPALTPADDEHVPVPSAAGVSLSGESEPSVKLVALKVIFC